MHALRINPGYFGIADYESDLILNRWSMLVYASPPSLLFPADWFQVSKSNIQIRNQHIKIGNSTLLDPFFSGSGKS